jgi:hypothetical protein
MIAIIIFIMEIRSVRRMKTLGEGKKKEEKEV